jgi:hypothetical protein
VASTTHVSRDLVAQWNITLLGGWCQRIQVQVQLAPDHIFQRFKNRYTIHIHASNRDLRDKKSIEEEEYRTALHWKVGHKCSVIKVIP